jgi:hypothetical protein
MPQTVPNRKPQILEILELLSSEERQLAYERNVPRVDITAELLCVWFDDQYHPNDAFFRSCFTEDELAALAEFHRFYDERTKQLPPSQGTVRTWLANPVWREIMRKSRETLSQVAA